MLLEKVGRELNFCDARWEKYVQQWSEGKILEEFNQSEVGKKSPRVWMMDYCLHKSEGMFYGLILMFTNAKREKKNET